MRMSLKLITLVWLLFGFGLSASAQLTFQQPASNTPIAACPDYAFENLYDRWDFSQSSDLPSGLRPRQLENVTNVSVTGGVLKFRTTTNNPRVALLTWEDYNAAIAKPESERYGLNYPINTSRYRQLNFRMKSDRNTFMQLLWYGPGSSFAISSPIQITAGDFKVYSIDLGTIGLNQVDAGGTWLADHKRGLVLRPVAESNANVELDWVTLTPLSSSCTDLNISFTDSTSDNVAAIFLDSNSNPLDGFNEHSLLATTGSQQNLSFKNTTLNSGNYSVYGYSGVDYAGLYQQAWDFSQSGDVTSSSNISSFQVNTGAGTLTGSTGSDGNFDLNVPATTPINTSLFKKLTVKMNSNKNTNAAFYWFNQSGALMGVSSAQSVSTGDNTLTFNLSSNPNWNGTVYRLRFDPDENSVGINFTIDYVALTPASAVVTSQPSPPTQILAGGQFLNDYPGNSKVMNPDGRGGRDCPTNDFGNPWNFDSFDDVTQVSNLISAEIYPHNVVYDSTGVAHTNDFLVGLSTLNTSGAAADPKVFPLLFDKKIDANRCVNACYSLILDRPTEIYHSVSRITYKDKDGGNQSGDDVVNPNKWSSDPICVELDTLQQEPQIAPGQTHPWNGMLEFLSIDPHEEDDPTRFYIDYFEIREDHKANSKFAIVVDAPLSDLVEIYSSIYAPTSRYALHAGAVKIGELPAGRNTNVFIWNTSAVSNGTYYISTRLVDDYGTSVRNAALPIVVDHGHQEDTTGPTVIVDAPYAGMSVASQLQVAGAAIDQTKVSVVEVFIDGDWAGQLKLSKFHKAARDNYRSVAENSPGFEGFFDVSALGAGPHLVDIVVYDNNGNSTTQSRSFTKGSDSGFYTDPPANGTPIAEPARSYDLSLNIQGAKDVEFSFGRGFNGCVGTLLEGARQSNFATSSPLLVKRGGGKSLALNVPRYTGSLGVKTCKIKKCKSVCRKSIKNKKKYKKCMTKCKRANTNCKNQEPDEGYLHFRATCESDPNKRSNVVSLDARDGLGGSSATSPYESDILGQISSRLN